MIHLLPERVFVYVNLADIATGGHSSDNCPLQRAMDRKYRAKASIGRRAMCMRILSHEPYVWYQLHHETIDWLCRYDAPSDRGGLYVVKPFVARAVYDPVFTAQGGTFNLGDGGIYKLT